MTGASGARLEVVIHVDGGSRGNPGPAAAAFVIAAADDGTVLQEAGLYLGRATNNVAEYRGLIAAFHAGARLGATHLDVRSDSELLVRQMEGVYRVKNAGLKPLFARACDLRDGFARCTVTHVRREDNTRADRLVNLALNRKGNVDELI